MEFTSELQLAIVSATVAVAVGGSVALFGHGPVLGLIGRLAGVALRRRRLTTLLLGSMASGGIAAANAIGLEPAAATDAVSWFHNQIESWQI